MQRKSNPDLALEALENHLFMNGWYMQQLMKDSISCSQKHINDTVYVIVYDTQKNPVSCGCYYKKERVISLFVKKEYRGKGYGKITIEKLLRKIRQQPTQVLAGYGIEGSDVFFNKMGIYNLDLSVYHFFGFTSQEEKEIKLKNKTVQEIFEARFAQGNIKYQSNVNITLDVDAFEQKMIEKLVSLT